MLGQRNIVCGILLLIAVAGQVASAQDAAELAAGEVDAPASESQYLDLRRSKDRVTRQWAERYSTLTKLQEWGSAKGKKVKAKYVSHTPDLASVTLALAQGKEVTVPVAQLDKASQSRVRQIGATRKKLDELIAEGAKGEPEENPPSDPGAPMVDERGVQPVPRRPRRPTRPTRDDGTPAEPPSGQSPAPAASSTADDGNSDPLGFGELGAAAPSTGVVQPPGTPANVTPIPPGTAAGNPIAGNVDAKQWTTSYDAFRANFVVNDDEGETKVEWGELDELRRVGEAVADLRRDPTKADANAFADRLAEVRWEARLKDITAIEQDTRVTFDLPPLLAPFQLEFSIDGNEDPTSDQWAFSSGDRISFAGRLAMAGPTSIVVVIREPVLIRAAVAPRR